MPPKKFKVKGKNQTVLYAVFGVVLAGVLIFGFATNWNFNLQTIGFQKGPDNVIQTKVIAANNASYDIDDDISRTWFEIDVADMTPDEIADLDLADFEQMSTSKAEITTAENYIYCLKVNGSKNGVSFQTLWLCTSALIANGKMELLIIGELNTIELYEVPADYDMHARPNDKKSATTVNNTDYNKWTVEIDCIDSNGEISPKAGYAANYDFENKYYNSTFLLFTFNGTVASDVVQITTGYDYVRSKASDTQVIIVIDCDYVSGNSFGIKFVNGFGSLYEVVSIGAGIGHEGSAPALITQF